MTAHKPHSEPFAEVRELARGAVLYPASKPLFDRDPSLPVGLHVGDDFTEVTDPASERES